MYKALTVAVALSLAAAGALAEPPAAAKPAGIDRKDYQWNAQDNPEKLKALRLVGDVKAGDSLHVGQCSECRLDVGKLT